MARSATTSANGWTCLIHIAQAGDTLIGLGQRYLVRTADWHLLAQLNHVDEPRRIPVGSHLCVPLERMRATPSEVQVVAAVGETNVRPGDLLQAGQSLHTGNNGYVTMKLADGSVLKVQSATDAQLHTSQVYESAGVLRTWWQLLRGRMESIVTKLPNAPPKLQIETPQATLAVRGTEFRVAVEGERTLAETLEGSVAIWQAQHPDTPQAIVAAGQGRLADARSGLSATKPLPAAPDIGQVPRLFEHPLMRIRLPALPQGHSYRLQVADDAQFQQVRAEVNSPDATVRVADLPDGNYHWRVRMSDTSGLSGPDAIGQLRLKARPEPPIPTAPLSGSKQRTRPIALSWTHHPQALHYQLQVSRNDSFTDLVVDESNVAEAQFSAPLLPGDYLWRLRTVAAPAGVPEGLDMGPWGSAQQLIVRAPVADLPAPTVTSTTLRFQVSGELGQRFEFQLARHAEFSQRLSELEVPAAVPSALAEMPRPTGGGRLFVRYRAIDADGFVGPYSSPQTLDLPNCLQSTDGACVTGASGLTWDAKP